jgi:hypothetical protein
VFDNDGTPVVVRLPELDFFGDKEGMPVAIHLKQCGEGRRRIHVVRGLRPEIEGRIIPYMKRAGQELVIKKSFPLSQ